MKKNDKQLLVNKTLPELNRELESLRVKLNQSRLDLAAGKLTKVSQIGLLKYQVALIKTVIAARPAAEAKTKTK